MNSTLQVRLMEAVGACLRPLVRMMLRSGISYRQFDELVKVAFVQESFQDATRATRRTNVSRISVRTGLSRKEVARIRDAVESGHSGKSGGTDSGFHSTLAARLLQIWHTDPKYLDKNGRPRCLIFDSGENSFATMVRQVGGDVPAGAVRAELIAAGAVQEDQAGRLSALKRHFIPGDLGEDMVVGFAHVVTPLLMTLAHNCESGRKDAFLQRVAYSECLSVGDTPAFREFATSEAASFVQSMDDWLGAREENVPVGSETEKRARVGVGVFYFDLSASQGGNAKGPA